MGPGCPHAGWSPRGHMGTWVESPASQCGDFGRCLPTDAWPYPVGFSAWGANPDAAEPHVRLGFPGQKRQQSLPDGLA